MKQRDDEDDPCEEGKPKRDALRKHESAEGCGGEEEGAEDKSLIKRHASILRVELPGAPDRLAPYLWAPPGPTRV